METYKKIDEEQLEEISATTRIIKKEDIARELEMFKRELEMAQSKIQELKNLLKKFE